MIFRILFGFFPLAAQFSALHGLGLRTIERAVRIQLGFGSLVPRFFSPVSPRSLLRHLHPWNIFARHYLPETGAYNVFFSALSPLSLLLVCWLLRFSNSTNWISVWALCARRTHTHTHTSCVLLCCSMRCFCSRQKKLFLYKIVIFDRNRLRATASSEHTHKMQRKRRKNNICVARFVCTRCAFICLSL